MSNSAEWKPKQPRPMTPHEMAEAVLGYVPEGTPKTLEEMYAEINRKFGTTYKPGDMIWEGNGFISSPPILSEWSEFKKPSKDPATLIESMDKETQDTPAHFLKWGRDYIPPLQCIDERFNH